LAISGETAAPPAPRRSERRDTLTGFTYAAVSRAAAPAVEEAVVAAAAAPDRLPSLRSPIRPGRSVSAAEAAEAAVVEAAEAQRARRSYRAPSGR